MTYTEDGIFISDAAGENPDSLGASLGHHILDKLNQHSEQILLVDVASGREWTGAKLKTTIMNIASALVDQFGLKQGQVACIKYINSDLKIILSLALACAGAATGYVHHKDHYDEVLRLARKTEFKFLFCHHQPDQVQMAQRLEQDMGFQVVAIAMDGPEGDLKAGTPFAHGHIEKLISYDHLKSKCAGSLPVKCKDISKDVAYFTTTSGTSGSPKTVPVTHLRFLVNPRMYRSPSGQNVPILCSTSFDYVTGYMTASLTISNGYRWIVTNCVEPENLFELIQRYKIQELLLGVQAFFWFITHKESVNYDLSSLKYVNPAGARVNYLGELEQFCAKHPNITGIMKGYGASECGIVSHKLKTVEEYLQTKDSGTLEPGARVKIVDIETGNPLGPNQQGLIHAKTSVLFPGYYDASLRDDPAGPYLRDATIFDQDGFYITGDIGYFDDHHNLTCLGRHSELMLVRDLWKVLPSELEAIIAEHPAVTEVCVLGIRDKINPSLHCPRAFVVPNLKYNLPIHDSDGNSTLLIPQPPVASSEPIEPLVFKGTNKLCGLSQEHRHRLAREMMEYFVPRVGWRKQLTGGIVLIDHIPVLKTSGKMDKKYLSSLTLDEIEIYGDRSNHN